MITWQHKGQPKQVHTVLYISHHPLLWTNCHFGQTYYTTFEEFQTADQTSEVDILLSSSSKSETQVASKPTPLQLSHRGTILARGEHFVRATVVRPKEQQPIPQGLHLHPHLAMPTEVHQKVYHSITLTITGMPEENPKISLKLHDYSMYAPQVGMRSSDLTITWSGKSGTEHVSILVTWVCVPCR